MTALSICSSALSDVMIRKSTFSGYEGVPPSSIEDSACIDLADVDTACNSRKDGVSINSTSDQSH